MAEKKPHETRWPVKEHLLDGRPVIIRPLAADDREALVHGYHELSPHSVYMRFLGYKSGLTETALDHLTHQHPHEDLTLGIKGGAILTVLAIKGVLAIGRIILAGGSAPEIRDEADREGIWDLRKAGLKKVRDGPTSLEEVNRVRVD